MIVRILTLLLFPTFLFAQNYKKLHKKAVLVYKHNDIPSSAIEKKVSFDKNLIGKTQNDITRIF